MNKKLQLLERYTSGLATPGERELVEDWFALLHMPVTAWDEMTTAEKELWLGELYGDIRAVIGQKKPEVVSLKRWAWSAAAAILLVVGGYFAIHKSEPQLTAFHAPVNHLRYLQLPDGSSVWVNAGSKLNYPVHFGGKTREVELSGEAYFDIKHDLSHPFLIHTGSVVTTVLGTAFNIKEDAVTHRVTVTVTRGRVSVGNTSRLLAVLTPDEQASVGPGEQRAIKQQVKAMQTAAWRGGDLHFDNARFADAVLQVAERYGISITISNENLKESRFTGTAPVDQPLDEVLGAMCSFNKARYQRNADGNIEISQ
jgi:ferric-dicitrate binding protein FerR (iron transport regulator)